MKGEAFCPAHVTGFFKAEFEGNTNPESLGSLGAGFSIEKGVTTRVTVKKAKDFDFRVSVLGYKSENILVSEFVIKEFLKNCEDNKFFVDVQHEISVPVGYGLGCSGAVALSLAMALNQALNTNLPKEVVGKIAHVAEINCKTGLGDVLASYHGGFEIRTKPGAPGIGSIEKITTDSNVILICFAPISTKKFIDEKLETINGLGGKMVSKLIKSKSYDDFQDMSLKFAKYVKVMTPRMDLVINDLQSNGIKCGVALFGETIFTLIPKNMEEKVMKILEKYSEGIIIKSKIDNSGARLQ
ncbi:GHMP kinase [Nitrosopumilus sp. b1]|uniref:pantoate kinase n=1 Tax=Nitrosopumilus sp. b1 TaxID=2109907 RepID=UPI0015F5C169|nr:GHMP kinase [Nitrosopumilus sp. b1]KAF6243067.1 GHMP kinase [Nitrosopumilus sp. b1]